SHGMRPQGFDAPTPIGRPLSLSSDRGTACTAPASYQQTKTGHSYLCAVEYGPPQWQASTYLPPGIAHKADSAQETTAVLFATANHTRVARPCRVLVHIVSPLVPCV